MRIYRRILLLALAMIMLVLMPTIVVQSAPEDGFQTVLFDSTEYKSECEQGVYLEFPADSPHVFVYNSSMIPIDFYINGINDGDMFTIDVVSTISISYTLSQSTFTKDSNHVSFAIEILQPPNVKSMDAVTYGYITITAISDNPNGESCELELNIINSKWGIFVGYVNEEMTYDFMAQSLWEYGLITAKECQTAVASSYIMDSSSLSKTTFAASDEMARNTGTEGTTVRVTYSINAINAGTTLNVNGVVTWTDVNGTAHPARGVKVEVVDEDVSLHDVVASVYTTNTGTFTTTFENQTGLFEGGCDIFLKIYPESASIRVANTLGSVYYVQTVNVQDNVMESKTNLFEMFGSSNKVNAFQVHQAGYIGQLYMESLTGSTPECVVFRYPYADSGANQYNGSYIKINESTYISWDVMLHEYGHYIADMYGISNSPGGTHYIDSNMIDNYVANGSNLTTAKDKGCRLAWSEGWATYFGISSQLQTGSTTLNVPGVGNAAYDDFNNNLHVNLETADGPGEACEMAVFCALWDIADSANTIGSVAENEDNVALGFDTILYYSIRSGATTYSEFMQYLYSQLGKTTANYRNLGTILGQQHMTARNLGFIQIVVDSPTFSWTLPNGSVQCANRYYFEVYDTSLNLLYSYAVPGSNNEYVSYAPPAATWSYLRSNYSSGFYWCIKTVPVSTPATGPYYSEFIRVNPS